MGEQNWTPVPIAPVIKDDIPPCERCHHRASEHHHATSCSARGRWGRRCKCSGYTRVDSTDPLAPGPPSPADP
jgi:hypothetical protein